MIYYIGIMFRSTRYVHCTTGHTRLMYSTVYCTVAIFAYYVNIFWIPRQTVTLIFLFDSVLYISETIYWKHTSGGKKTQKNWIFLDLSLSSSVIGPMSDRPDILRIFIKSKRLTNSALSWSWLTSGQCTNNADILCQRIPTVSCLNYGPAATLAMHGFKFKIALNWATGLVRW